jgi:hypothetical protein
LRRAKSPAAEDRHRPGLRVGQGADHPQQRRTAGRAGQPAAQPGTSAAAQRQPDRLQHPVQAAGAAPVPGGQARDLLGERRLSAPAVAAEEPADLQAD